LNAVTGQVISVIRIRDRLRLSVDRLWDGSGMLEKEDGNFLVDLLAHIHRTMHVIGWLIPINLSRREFNAMARRSVTVLDPQGIAVENDRNAMARITVPRRALTGFEAHPANQGCLAPVEDFLGHSLALSRSQTLT
jgi:hypothetical protein